MSTDLHNKSHSPGEAPLHADVSFEKTDVNTKSILWYLFFLAVAVALSFYVCTFVYNITSRQVEQNEPPMPASMQNTTQEQRDKMQQPKGPRLQGVPGNDNDAQQDLRELIEKDTKANERTAWIDEKAGIAQIPVSEAMKNIAKKGLSAGTSAPAPKK